MADISIQFHALAEELMDFFGRCVAEHNLRIVKITFPPYHAEEVDGESLADMFSDSSPVREVAFTLGAPALPAKGNMEFCENNPDALHLDIGKRSEKGVTESHLTTRTNNEEALGIWKSIANKLKGITTEGATATNPNTGVSSQAKRHRFTAGAKELDASGVPMVSITGIILRPVITRESYR